MNRLAIDRVSQILEAARSVRALVVGDLMLDKYITGSVARISPEAPVPVVRVESESSAIGGAANVAANVVALGATAGVVGCVGTDENGVILRAALEAAGVMTDGLVETTGRPTTVKTRVLARHQQVVRVDREVSGDVDAQTAARLAEVVGRSADGCDVLILEDYNKGVLVPSVIEAALAAGGSRDIPTVVDPKRLRFWQFGGASVFKPNAKELAESLGEEIHPEDPEWMEATRARLHTGALLLTLGEEGMAVKGTDGLYVRLPAVARDVYDVSGAGDTVTAVVAVLLASGATLEEASVVANHAAAIEVSKAGVATVTPAEILHQYERYDAS